MRSSGARCTRAWKAGWRASDPCRRAIEDAGERTPDEVARGDGWLVAVGAIAVGLALIVSLGESTLMNSRTRRLQCRRYGGEGTLRSRVCGAGPGHLRVLVHAGQSAAEDAKQTHFVLLDVCACLGKIPVDWA